jgi:predicted dehydrogenase
MITTRHDLHARLTTEALQEGKHVFVEKPLALHTRELNELIKAYSVDRKGNKPTVTVGFNRRFSAFAQKAKALIGSADTPVNIIATMNAGSFHLRYGFMI